MSSDVPFHVSPADLDVITLRPGDKLVVRARVPITLEEAHRIREVIDEMLGPQWGVILGPELEVIVMRREDQDTREMESSPTLAGMVIDFDRSLHLHAVDPEWSAWLGPRLSECVALEVTDDSLTRWRALYAQPQGRQYLVPITTPPGKREWLIG